VNGAMIGSRAINSTQIRVLVHDVDLLGSLGLGHLSGDSSPQTDHQHLGLGQDAVGRRHRQVIQERPVVVPQLTHDTDRAVAIDKEPPKGLGGKGRQFQGRIIRQAGSKVQGRWKEITWYSPLGE
jgi:hypothetical protein